MEGSAVSTRKRRLKVYCGNYDGRYEVIMACHSFREFQAETRINRNYGHEIGTVEEVQKAMSEPGVKFKRLILAPPGTPWERMP
jgi:hypothetical protein